MGEYIQVPYTRITLPREEKYDLAYDRYQSLTPTASQSVIKNRCITILQLGWGGVQGQVEGSG